MRILTVFALCIISHFAVFAQTPERVDWKKYKPRKKELNLKFKTASALPQVGPISKQEFPKVSDITRGIFTVISKDLLHILRSGVENSETASYAFSYIEYPSISPEAVVPVKHTSRDGKEFYATVISFNSKKQKKQNHI